MSLKGVALLLLTMGSMMTYAERGTTVWGDSVGVRLEKQNGEVIETLLAKDKGGVTHEILKTPTAKGLPLSGDSPAPAGLESIARRNLFRQAPSLRFEAYQSVTMPNGDGSIVLAHDSGTVKIRKTLTVPRHGDRIRVDLQAEFVGDDPTIEHFLATYAFAPDGKTISKGGMPDSTFSPGLRKEEDQVVGDHFFRSPAISAQKGTLAALFLPDVEVLAKNRPLPTIVDLDCRNGVVDAPLMSYGFCDHRLVSHVAFAHTPGLVSHVPKSLNLGMDVIVTAEAPPFGAYQIAADESWKIGSTYFDKILPQAMPFADYAKFCYPASFVEKEGENQLGWFEQKIGDHVCGGVMAGWGYQQGWASWQCWFNNLRSAWGLRWWGEKLGNREWVVKSDKMLNLALAAPMDHGACPTTYKSGEKEWQGCLIKGRDDCYYDLTNMAWKGIWLLKWLDFPDCPRKEEVLEQCQAMAECMMRVQNSDGSYPTWLDKSLKPVAVLDHSAQSALPGWFIAEMAHRKDQGEKSYAQSSKRAADFLVAHVVDQQLYYDFETFFSCSPKKCLQADGKLDDAAMHDPHTLCPPQNTLCMQWTAECLRAVSHNTGDKAYMPYALKALDMMVLYQEVWPISYIKAAYTYGGFGVQNSDGEYNDARQAQFGQTLCDFGAELNRKDYFERGVAATRASLTLINHPLHSKYGIYPNPNYPPGLTPENCGHGGFDEQDGRTGFDWGEGSGLTSMAYLLKTYGETYQCKDWSVLVDGGSRGIEMLKGKVPVVETPAPAKATVEGSVGVGTWATQAEFKDATLSFSGQKVYLSHGTAGWSIGHGKWSDEGDLLRQTSDEVETRAICEGISGKDYTLNLKARKISGAEGFFIYFHFGDDENFWRWNIGGWGNQFTAVEKSENGAKQIVGDRKLLPVENDHWYDVKLEIVGSNLKCYLDGKLIEELNR